MLKFNHSAIILFLLACGCNRFSFDSDSPKSTPAEQETSSVDQLDSTAEAAIVTDAMDRGVQPKETKPNDYDIKDAAELLDRCSKPGTTFQTISQVLNFPDRISGPFCQTGGGLGGLVGYSEEPKTISLPANSLVCGLVISSDSPTLVNKTLDFRYDDVEFLTLANYLLLTTHDEYINRLPKVNGHIAYDWKSVNAPTAEPTQSGNKAWCLGGAASECLLPQVDAPGPVKVRFDEKAFSELAFQIYKSQKALDFKLITAGDDINDCLHSNLSLEVSLRVMEIVKP